MASSSKILTVSYGTFSCTAEGFDDPLEVVKETTQFFRGVVGEDRFFGAEPPQFDPELASEYLRDRLADSGGTLSIGSPPRVMAAAASAGAMAAAFDSGPRHVTPSAQMLPDDDTIEATAVLTERPVPEADETLHEVHPGDTAPDGPEVTPAPLTSAPDDIAAKLNRIRAVVAQNDDEIASPPVQPEVQLDDTPEAPVVADPVMETATVVDATPEAPHPQEDALEGLLDELVVESGDADEIDLSALADTLAAQDATEDLIDDLSVAEELDPEPADKDASLMDRALPVAATAAIAALAASVAKSAPAEDEKTDTAGAWDDDRDPTEDALDQAWAASPPPPPPTIETAQEDDVWTAADDIPPPAPIPAAKGQTVRARVVKVKRAALEQAIDDGMLEEVPEDAAPSAPKPPAAAKPASLAPTLEPSSLSPEEEDELARELAAVKAELASDFGAWDEDDAADATLADAPAQPVNAADLYDDEDEDEDDAALLAAAAATVAGTFPERQESAAPLRLDNPIAGSEALSGDPLDDVIGQEVRDSARKAVKMASPARALLTEHEVEDDDTSRLIDQTNSEMDEPEGNRRRSAIAHLRAAVAATKADRFLSRKTDAAEEQEPYREDLASVVRPRRPQSVGVRTERPVTEPAPQATPLKLVAEQRVQSAPADDPDAEAATVRPRRVRRSGPAEASTPTQGDADNTSGFALYAQSVGAADLPELLEAAAAYMSYVEGRDQFSRPQLMSTLRQAESADSSREDRLRSFGQLLRDGKIRKTSGGRFTAADHISFKPDRAANG